MTVSTKSKSLIVLLDVQPPTFQCVDKVAVVAPCGYITIKLFESAKEK